MKTIQLSDDDYDLLMDLSKELQTQQNHFQAFPYFWEPASEKLEINFNNEGAVFEIYDENRCDIFSPESYAETHEELFDAFLKAKYPEDKEYDCSMESDWLEYLEENVKDLRMYSSDWKQKTDHNPSLFLSDVQNYIKLNKHHLGRKPHTYARTIFRMPKMEKLIGVLCRINTEPGIQRNPEIITMQQFEMRVKNKEQEENGRE